MKVSRTNRNRKAFLNCRSISSESSHGPVSVIRINAIAERTPSCVNKPASSLENRRVDESQVYSAMRITVINIFGYKKIPDYSSYVLELRRPFLNDLRLLVLSTQQQ